MKIRARSRQGTTDAKTIWLFREQLTETQMTKPLFDRFDTFLRESGFAARKGQIVDASIIPTPCQRNSRDENKQNGEVRIPDDWSQNKKRQKDTDACWLKKNGQTHYGYKNHIEVDVAHKLIGEYDVTPASTHDSQVIEEFLDETNTSRDVWADSAYWSQEKLDFLAKEGFHSHSHLFTTFYPKKVQTLVQTDQ